MTTPAAAVRSTTYIENRFYRRLGKALAEWAHVEFSMSLWFTAACGAEPDTAHRLREVFYSARSFNGSADMLKAAFFAVERDKEMTEFFRAAINRTLGYYAFRNKLAHQLMIHVAQENRFVLQHGNDLYRVKGEVTARDLVLAVRNFSRLRFIWRYTLHQPDRKEPLEPREALRRIEALPAEAHSTGPSQRQRGRQRQRLLRGG